MKIVFLNIWRCKLEKELEGFISEQVMDTDIFCFQEADGNAKSIFKLATSDYRVISDTKHIDKCLSYDLITCIRNDIEFLSSESLFKDKDNIGFGLSTQVKYNERIINICNFHGNPHPSDKLDNKDRVYQALEIMNRYKGLEGVKIIGGDFNLDINTNSVKLFEDNGYVNLIKKFNIPTTRNKVAWDRYPGNEQIFADYTFIDDNTIVKDFKVPSIEVSDHLPMILELEL